MANEKESVDSEQAEKPKNNMLMFAGITLLLVALSVGGTLFFMGGESNSVLATTEAVAVAVAVEPSVSKKPLANAIYVELDPAFTVNLMGGSSSKFLQIAVSILTYYDDSEESIQRHIPEIRNSLLMLFGEQKSQKLGDVKSKEILRSKALEAVKKVLSERGEKVDIEALFFTKFVMQ
ncbi:MAG: flagellar basal body-associated FliL family protein [Gammaproteobacteria bacterium]|nr:flagellar basal body-associated FliL family protein [Gammaproteobacteria bacterium]